MYHTNNFTPEAIEHLVQDIGLKRIPLVKLEKGGYGLLEDWAQDFIPVLAAVGLCEIFGYSQQEVLALKSPKAAVICFFRHLKVMGYLDAELDKAEVLHVNYSASGVTTNRVSIH